MIRVASLKDMVQVKYNKKDISGMTPAEQLAAINERTHLFVKDQYDIFNRSLIPALEKEGVHVLSHYENLSDKQSKYVDRYFTDEVYPVLTPMAVDSSRPFPLIRNKTLNIGAILRMKKDKAAGGQFRDLYLSHGNKKKGADSNDTDFATVQVPSVLPRFVEIPSEQKGEKTFILLEQIIEKNIGKLFVNYEIESVFPYRIMRNADLSIEEDEAADLLIEIERQLKKRQWGQAIRLEVEAGMDKRLLKKLRQELKIKEEDIFKINGPLDLTFLMKLSGLEGYDKLRTPKYTPQPAKWLNGEDHLFDQIRDHDVLLHHPYETFDPVVDFVKQASKDPNVLAIKQTLYRVSSHSPIIASLAQAAENGKQVWNKLAIAPIRLRDRFTQLINREKEFAKKGKKAFIRAKMNSLCDAGIISSLYEAAAAGVKIELVVRGICCLKTGMPGISENITVRSIVGDFLEHSRIFHFYNNGFEEVYMGSADWMPRNLDKRVEILFPVEDDALKAEVIHILDIQLADNEKARILQKNGTYRRAAKGGHAKLNSQKYFCEEAKRAQKERKKQNKNTHTFEPLHSVPEE